MVNLKVTKLVIGQTIRFSQSQVLFLSNASKRKKSEKQDKERWLVCTNPERRFIRACNVFLAKNWTIIFLSHWLLHHIRWRWQHWNTVYYIFTRFRAVGFCPKNLSDNRKYIHSRQSTASCIKINFLLTIIYLLQRTLDLWCYGFTHRHSISLTFICTTFNLFLYMI